MVGCYVNPTLYPTVGYEFALVRESVQEGGLDCLNMAFSA